MTEPIKINIAPEESEMVRSLAALPPEGQEIVTRFAFHQGLSLSVMVARQHKYGPHNISQAGFNGVLVRLGDKLARLRNGTGNLGDESLADTLYDVANYAIIALMVHEGSWPKPSETSPKNEIEQLLGKIAAAKERLESLGYYDKAVTP